VRKSPTDAGFEKFVRSCAPEPFNRVRSISITFDHQLTPALTLDFRPAEGRLDSHAVNARAHRLREDWQGRTVVVDIDSEERTEMATAQIEERLAVLEAEIAQLKKQMAQGATLQRPWWKEIAGSFANDPVFQKAMKLGEDYRRSLRPKRGKRRRKLNVRSRHRPS